LKFSNSLQNTTKLTEVKTKMSDTHEYVTREILRPRHPDGEKYLFNCCWDDDVWRTEDDKSICRNCGHDWTEELGIDNNTEGQDDN
jgi:hypothetical protein